MIKGETIKKKRRKCWLLSFSPFLTMFSKDRFFRVVKTSDFVVNQVCPLPDDIKLVLSKLKAFTDNFIGAQMAQFLFDWTENIVGEGENAGYEHFLLIH